MNPAKYEFEMNARKRTLIGFSGAKMNKELPVTTSSASWPAYSVAISYCELKIACFVFSFASLAFFFSFYFFFCSEFIEESDRSIGSSSLLSSSWFPSSSPFILLERAMSCCLI
jgi:hypothetical protein